MQSKLPKGTGLALCLVIVLAGASFIGSEPGIRFADVTVQAGLRAPLDGMMGHAATWGDIDGDGDLDLYVGGFGDRPDAEYRPAPGPVHNSLFRNVSNGKFEQVSNPAVELNGRTSAAAFVDLDNDGRLDLVVANNTQASSALSRGPRRDAQLRRSAVFRNEGTALVDASDAAGACVTGPGAARSIGVLDYDADGALDLLVLIDRFQRLPRSRLCRNL
ncbi:MAG: VCBS repeat-containing protein, partial [Acidobacteria bacterium]